MVKEGNQKHILIVGKGSIYDELSGLEKDGYRICELTYQNRLVLNKYFVTIEVNKIKPLSEISDESLAKYMDDNNGRQIINITYGILLQAIDEKGKSLFKEEFYETLNKHEDEYKESLINHIGKHLALLGK